MKSDNCYVVISLDNMSIDVCIALTQVAKIIGCNRKTLGVIDKRTYRDGYIIHPTPIQKMKSRGKSF